MASSASALPGKRLVSDVLPRLSDQNSLAVKTDESKAPALFGAIVLGDVSVTNAAVLLEETLEVLRGGPVAQSVHLEADHLSDVRGRTLATAASVSASVSVRHPLV